MPKEISVTDLRTDRMMLIKEKNKHINNARKQFDNNCLIIDTCNSLKDFAAIFCI